MFDDVLAEESIQKKEKAIQKKEKAEKVNFYLRHNFLEKRNFSRIFSEARSGRSLTKTKKELRLSPNMIYTCP